jgi:Zn-dependent protease/predicted transcriptional regulator
MGVALVRTLGSEREKTSAKARMRSGIGLGKLFGIKIRVDFSLLVIFLLVAVSLGAGVFPSWHPDWTPTLVWSVAFIAAVLFFVSVLLHELAHALVAKAFGARVRSITLFLFGGMANIEREPATPKEEALIAGVGPLTSIAIGIVCATIAGAATAASANVTSDPIAAIERLSPAVTLLAWLGPVNIVLGLFNLLPGFPLDGGRLFRAFLWSITGDLRRATRWASEVGRAIGFGLIAIGILMAFGVSLPIFGSGVSGGLWLALIGLFLSNAASSSYQQLVMRELLAHVPVGRLMRTRSPIAVDAHESVRRVVEDYVLPTGESSFPVVIDGVPVGMVRVADLRRVPREAWDTTSVSRIAIPLSRLTVVERDDEAFDAVQELGREDSDALLVVERDGRLAGVVRRQDIARWMEFQARDERKRPSLPRSARTPS